MRRTIAPALLIFLASPTMAQEPGNLAAAGRYSDRAGPDVVSELVLAPNGRFQFFLSAGALDSRAEGRWTSDGRTVVLNTDPRPTPPEFTVGPVTRGSEDPILILVNWPNERGAAGIDVRVGFDDGSTLEGYTQENGWRPYEERVGTPRWVELSALPFGVPMRRFELDAQAGNIFTFTLVPNDLGIADFRDAPAEITPDGLTLLFMGGPLPFARAE